MKVVLRKLLRSLVGLALVLLLFHLFPLNVTASMPFGVYMRLPAIGIKEGDYVSLDNPLAIGAFGVKVLTGILKRVESITDEGLYVVKGEHEYSYDSRYYGAIGGEYIRNRLLPLITFRTLPDWLAEKEETID